jgi:hypothetical protein
MNISIYLKIALKLIEIFIKMDMIVDKHGRRKKPFKYPLPWGGSLEH